MLAGDSVLVGRLIEEADSPRAQMDLADLIDRSIGSFGGGDITRILLDRIDRRGKVSVGEAHYLAQHVRVADLPQLERLRQICVDVQTAAATVRTHPRTVRTGAGTVHSSPRTVHAGDLTVRTHPRTVQTTAATARTRI
jgi:hypothetical protein